MTEYKKSELLPQIESLRQMLCEPGRFRCLTLCGEEYHEWETLFAQLIPLSSKWGDTLTCNHDENPEQLISCWNKVFEEDIYDGDEDGILINNLVIRTKKFLRSLYTIPYKEKALRKMSTKSIENAIERVADQQEKISAQLKREKQKAKPDETVIQNLEKLKEISDSEVENLYKEKNQQELEEASEQDWNDRIRDSFQVLRSCTNDLETERSKADTEYTLFLYALILPSIILLIWLCKLYGYLVHHEGSIDSWTGFLPYYLPVPIFVAMFWLFIVQKNRAGKISIALSERLYQIKYLEGLLMTINRLSPNTQEAIETISLSLDKMVNGYLHKVSREPLDEIKLEEIEKKEWNEDVYLKIIDKLSNLVKK